MKFLSDNQIKEVFLARHACKAFAPNRAINDDDFRAILESARLSPSSFGFEPWRFVVLRDKNIKKAIFDVTWGGQDALENASEFVLILARKMCDTTPHSAYLTGIMRDTHKLDDKSREARTQFYEMFQREHFCNLGDSRKMFDWACKQCYIALGNMLTTAALLGLDSLPIECFNREGVESILAKHNALDREHFGVAVMAAFGYRLNAPKHTKTRQEFSEVVKFI